MSYIKKTLLQEETILYFTKPHYIIFYPMLLWLALAIWFFDTTAGTTLLGTIALIASIFSCINSLINYYTSEYAITNKRVIIKFGFIRRQSLEVFLERIEGIYIEQSIIGRILNFGTVIIGGIGGTKNPFPYIPDPIKFRSSVQQQIEANALKK